MNDQTRLSEKLEQLIAKQNQLSKEIIQLRAEFKAASEDKKATTPQVKDVTEKARIHPSYTQESEVTPPKKKTKQSPFKVKAELEKFIGENLISKIGIVILILGVAIGAKYSIEHNLINPLTRIILGYVAGITLLGFGIRLKSKYENYSSVLVSGAMAIFYFITFFAYSFYGLIPQLLAFVMMFIFTALTVFAALNYNKQVIALIGLVGAYAVPMLLSDGSGKVLFFYSYIAIINAGLMVLAIKRDWRPVFYLAFVLTWFLFFTWNITSYEEQTHFEIALFFCTLFFIEFYITFLAYKVLKNIKLNITDVSILLINSFIYFGLGMYIFDSRLNGDEYFGLFTVFNAFIHFVAAYILFKRKQADEHLFYLLAGLVLVFITIAIPIQLDGNWVTLLWIGETALLFWIGRTKNQPLYEGLSYILLFISCLSLVLDWEAAYYSGSLTFKPIINIHFLSTLLFCGVLAFISFTNAKVALNEEAKKQHAILSISNYLPHIFIIGIFCLFYNEISHFWDVKTNESLITVADDYGYIESEVNPSYKSFRIVWLINYLLAFVGIITLVLDKVKAKVNFKQFDFYILTGAICIYLILGLYEISELRELYTSPKDLPYTFGKWHLYIRYISYLFIGFALYVLYIVKRKQNPKLNTFFDLVLYTALVWIASSELLHWMDLYNSRSSYKLALSILWGSSSLALVAIGMWQKNKHLRIGAIGLFALTLLKVFIYDIAHLSTISKTIVFIALGVLLLIISYLYNKNKHRIFDEN